MLSFLYKCGKNRQHKREIKFRKNAFKRAKRTFVIYVLRGYTRFHIDIYTSSEKKFEEWLEKKKKKINFTFSKEQPYFKRERSEFYFEILESENQKLKEEYEDLKSQEDNIYEERSKNHELTDE